MINNFAEFSIGKHCNLSFRINKFEGSHLENTFYGILEPGNYSTAIKGPDESEWVVDSQMVRTNDGMDLLFRFELETGDSLQTNVAVCLEFDNWSRENYVLMPSGAYNGNRYESRKYKYPPTFFGNEPIGPDMPTIISDVPRLNINDGDSIIRLMTRDLATPAVGFYSPENEDGFWLITQQGTDIGDYGIELEENENRTKADLRISAPGVRPDFRYIIANNKYPSEDRAHDFRQSDSVEIRMKLHFFKCSGVQKLFDRFTDIRKELVEETVLVNSIPFSAAWDIQEKKYNEQNWEDVNGYYSVGMRDNLVQDWQVGWVGGMISTYPLLFEGTDLSRQRALRNFDFLFNGGQDQSGLFYAMAYKGKFYGDYDVDPSKRAHLIRRSGDALYYIIKQFMLFKKKNILEDIPAKWIKGTKDCADALVKLWDRYGQFGQFADSLNGEILIGGSACGSIVPAALAMAWNYFGEIDYMRVSKQSGQFFYENFVKRGVTTGGPGDMLQCPDSESAFGMLESFITMYEVFGEQKWLDYSADMANQCFTWCVSYDFKFPAKSTFGKLDMRTTGSVYANVQNKHSAPGICTHSGLSLFKLYRATGDYKYLELIREIAHNMPQYLSREDRPVTGLVNYWTDFKDGKWYPENMPAGWMSERVQMSDWLEPVGEIFWGSCWCEISNMLTFIEVPGLYIQPDTGLISAIDHVEAKIIGKNPGGILVEIKNTTEFEARVKVFVENSTEMKKIMGQNALADCLLVQLNPGQRQSIMFKK